MLDHQTSTGRVSNLSKKEIDALFDQGTAVYKSKELVIITAPCTFMRPKILLITSRKVGNAPQRNLLRRQGRAIFYEEKLWLQKITLAIIFKSPAKQLSFLQLKNILVKATQDGATKINCNKPKHIDLS